MSTETRATVTPEQYLARERAAEYKSEYLDGEVVALAGASRRHSLIAGSLFARLWSALEGRGCEVHMGDLRVGVPRTRFYAYPDVVAVCGEPHLEDEHGDTLLNPGAIIEVLSPSTERYDRGAKFAHYRRLDSLADYVLVAQERMRVEHYTGQGELWVLREWNRPEHVLRLEELGCELALRDIYARVALDASPESSPSPPPHG